MSHIITGYSSVIGSLLLMLIVLFSGCGKSSTGNEGGITGTAGFRVTVRDDTGKPLPDFTVTTDPATKSALGDSTGTALLENIREGDCRVIVSKQGYPTFSKTATALSGQIVNLVFTYIPRVEVTVRDEMGRPSVGAVITTVPASSTQTTNQNGLAVFHNIPAGLVTFSILRGRYAQTDTTVEVNSRELRLTVSSTPPRMEILAPKLDHVFTGPHNIMLSGLGTDIEDGNLPDSSLVWSSNLQGELGRGKMLTVPYLRPGYHTITLRGTDSDHQTGVATVSFSVFDYQLDSWFPIPAGESWGYRYTVTEFWVTNEYNVQEYWVLKNLSARVDSESRRVVDITWDAILQSNTTHFRLTLSDSLIQENGNLYIGQTIEKLQEWLGSAEKPNSIMNIATTYTPRFLFLKNVTDIAKEKKYESSVRMETQYQYIDYSDVSTVFHESQFMTSSVEIGGESNEQTDRGYFTAIAVTFRQNETEKKWYLSRGLGLIRLEDSALSVSTEALLNSASMLRFVNKAPKDSGSGTAFRIAPPRYDLKINRKNPKDLIRLHRFLKSMSPVLM